MTINIYRKSPYIFVVIELGDMVYLHGGWIHGVYTSLDIAKAKRAKVTARALGRCGYIAILKKPVQGPGKLSYSSIEDEM